MLYCPFSLTVCSHGFQAHAQWTTIKKAPVGRQSTTKMCLQILGLPVMSCLNHPHPGNHQSDTVDGQNPASPGMVKNPINNGIIIILGGAGFCPSTVFTVVSKQNPTFDASVAFLQPGNLMTTKQLDLSPSRLQ